MHNVRLMWLEGVVLELMGKGWPSWRTATATPAPCGAALEASGKAVAALVRKSAASGGKVKGFKPHVTAFVGDPTSDQSHHRGQVGWDAEEYRQPAARPDTVIGLWEAGHPLVRRDGSRR